MTAIGEEFARLLRETPHSHQLGVCAMLDIPWSTHMTRMSGKAEPGSDLAGYQSAVTRGLDDARRRDLDGIEVAVEDADNAKVATVFNMRKHRHESRFKRFYEETSKVELSGPDGAPIQHAVATMSDAALYEMVHGKAKE